MSTETRSLMDVLHEDGLYEILRSLPGDEARSKSACVSKQWLMLLSRVRKSDILHRSNDDRGPTASSIIANEERSLEGNEATDIRLAAIAVGTCSRGGLKLLEIRDSHPIHGVSDVGLKSIACGSPGLKFISLCAVPSITDEGFLDIAKECHLLEELDLCECPNITNRGFMEIAKSSPNLASLVINSCQSIDDQNFQAIGSHCPKLKSVSIVECPLLRDQGVMDLLFSTASVLTELQLQGANLGNETFGMVKYLKKLVMLTVSSCNDLTDEALLAIGHGCCALKKVHLCNCSISDAGIIGFVKATVSVKSLKLEKCDKITLLGVFGILSSCGSKLRSLALVKSKGIKDLGSGTPSFVPCKSICLLTITKCSGFGNSSLDLVRKLCPNLHNLKLYGLGKITDSGLLPLLKSYKDGLEGLKLRSCFKVTHKAVSCIARLHGATLDVLNLKGCVKVTDASLVEIACYCSDLIFLDVSGCSITDFGINALSTGVLSRLEILFISGCSGLTNESLPSLLKLGEHLICLKMENCNSISTNTVELLKERLEGCKIYS